MQSGISQPVEVVEENEISYKKFTELTACRQPLIIRGLNIGLCTKKWTSDYLIEKYGTVECTAQVSSNPRMNFVKKNFVYQKMTFGELVQNASSNEPTSETEEGHQYWYFRSLGEDVRKDVSNFHKQFPLLANDVSFPNLFQKEDFFSSVFRLASRGTQLWTHYDVMDNMLLQIAGDKKIVLYPPSDALNLYLKGDKSEVMDIENPDLKKFPKFALVNSYECVMKPGDLLFIPALWFHNVTSLDFGVAINVFWKNLPSDMYDKRDIYGNKDLVAAARGMDVLNRALGMLKPLPSEYKDFYSRMMIKRIEDKFLLPHPHPGPSNT